MRGNEFLDKMELVKPEYVEAADKTPNRKKKGWVKWVSMAACLALIVVAGLPLVTDFTQRSDKNITDSVLLVEYDNAYYEVIENNPEFLERKGIETDISEEFAGNHIAYLKKENESERSNYIVSEEKSNIELLEYAPANHKAVRILRDGDMYFAVVFCNYLIEDTESLPFDEVLNVYGITKAEDIKSIVSVKTDNEYNADGTAVTDRIAIASFYNEIINLEQYSEDEFDEIQFVYTDEGKADEYHGQFADDRKDFMIETADGLKLIISYYSTYDWLRGSLTQTYYKLSPALETWIEENLK